MYVAANELGNTHTGMCNVDVLMKVKKKMTTSKDQRKVMKVEDVKNANRYGYASADSSLQTKR